MGDLFPLVGETFRFLFLLFITQDITDRLDCALQVSHRVHGPLDLW